MTDRDELEEVALKTVSATNYYDLADNISVVSDQDLRDIIACDGDEGKEEKLAERKIKEMRERKITK